MSTQYVPMWNCDWVMYRLNNSAYKCVSQQEYESLHKNESQIAPILIIVFGLIPIFFIYFINKLTNNE